MTADRLTRLSEHAVIEASRTVARENLRFKVNPFDWMYHNNLRTILDQGYVSGDRTGTGTVKTFSPPEMTFDLSQGHPVLTTKEVHLRSVTHELLWFLQGDTNICYLNENRVRIWDEWADANGELGPVYGQQWVAWEGKDGTTYDQISAAQDIIRNNPNSRRILVNAWNVPLIDQMALPPCHVLFQFQVEENRLNCKLYQRSADWGLGVPFNTPSYALLLSMMAQTTGLERGRFIHSFGDAHVYLNHVDELENQLKLPSYEPPSLVLNPDIKNIFDFRYEDIEVRGYEHHPKIHLPISV